MFQNYRHINYLRNYRTQPSGRAWNRLERRLDQDKGKVSRRSFQTWIGAAALIIILIATTAALNIFHTSTETTESIAEENLITPVNGVFSDMDIARLNQYYRSNRWKNIDEGSSKKFMVN